MSADANGWRDISSAPKDGAAILIWTEDNHSAPQIACWQTPTEIGRHFGWSGWVDWRHGNDCGYPTHWQPLPSPPIPTAFKEADTIPDVEREAEEIKRAVAETERSIAKGARRSDHRFSLHDDTIPETLMDGG